MVLLEDRPLALLAFSSGILLFRIWVFQFFEIGRIVLGITLFTQSLKQVSKEFELILIITHLDNLKHEFPANIDLTKLPDFGTEVSIELY